MKTRIITGVIAIGFLAIVLLFFHTILFNLICMTLTCIAFYEILHAFKQEKQISILIFFGAIPALIYAFILSPLGYSDLFNVVLVFSVLYYTGLQVFFFKKLSFDKLAAILLFGIYVLIGFYSTSQLNTNYPLEIYGYDGIFYVLLILAIAWGADIFAYFIGVSFGKHKLAPALSPKKSIEGAVGGFFGGIIIGVLALYLYNFISAMFLLNFDTVVTFNNYIAVAILSAVGSLISMVGDLFASAIKRQNDVKDYGYILPGHGGILDRFDSVLLLAPVVVMYINFTPIIG